MLYKRDHFPLVCKDYYRQSKIYTDRTFSTLKCTLDKSKIAQLILLLMPLIVSTQPWNWPGTCANDNYQPLDQPLDLEIEHDNMEDDIQFNDRMV